ncbi:MAG: hypothetical protein LN412_06130 [Candidatus Thermoplasmatota archaeon]|nr:hypothetical protein [Candidatus Thermoplasmatota archaeon]
MTIIKPHILAALARLRPIDWQKARLYRWERNIVWPIFGSDVPRGMDEITNLANLLAKAVRATRNPIVVINPESPGPRALIFKNTITLPAVVWLGYKPAIAHEIAHLVRHSTSHNGKFVKVYCYLLSHLPGAPTRHFFVRSAMRHGIRVAR